MFLVLVLQREVDRSIDAADVVILNVKHTEITNWWRTDAPLMSDWFKCGENGSPGEGCVAVDSNQEKREKQHIQSTTDDAILDKTD